MFWTIAFEILFLWVCYAAYHSVHVKQWKMLQLIPFSVPLAALAGGLYWLIGKMM